MAFTVKGLSEYPDVRDQQIDKIEERNRIIEKECRSPSYIGVVTETKGTDFGVLRAVRCRKCKHCLLLRQKQWAYRATVEFLAAPRTWWITLSYRGSYEPTYEDVKKFFKRLRKSYGQKKLFRYVISEEKGTDNGRLHWHVLLHCEPDLTRRKIESTWGLGYVHSRLARSAGLGSYLAKYLAKQSRIRASQYYGDQRTARRVLGEDTWNDFEQYVLTGTSDNPDGYAEWLSRFGVKIPLAELFAATQRTNLQDHVNKGGCPF